MVKLVPALHKFLAFIVQVFRGVLRLGRGSCIRTLKDFQQRADLSRGPFLPEPTLFDPEKQVPLAARLFPQFPGASSFAPGVCGLVPTSSGPRASLRSIAWIGRTAAPAHPAES